MIRYPRRFRCRGPHVTPPDLRPKTHVFEWHVRDIQTGGHCPAFDSMCRTVLGIKMPPEFTARHTAFSQVLQALAHAKMKLGILEYQTWDAEGGYVQGIRVIKKPRLSPKLVATMPLLKRPKL